MRNLFVTTLLAATALITNAQACDSGSLWSYKFKIPSKMWAYDLQYKWGTGGFASWSGATPRSVYGGTREGERQFSSIALGPDMPKEPLSISWRSVNGTRHSYTVDIHNHLIKANISPCSAKLLFRVADDGLQVFASQGISEIDPSLLLAQAKGQPVDLAPSTLAVDIGLAKGMVVRDLQYEWGDWTSLNLAGAKRRSSDWGFKYGYITDSTVPDEPFSASWLTKDGTQYAFSLDVKAILARSGISPYKKLIHITLTEKGIALSVADPASNYSSTSLVTP